MQIDLWRPETLRSLTWLGRSVRLCAIFVLAGLLQFTALVIVPWLLKFQRSESPSSLRYVGVPFTIYLYISFVVVTPLLAALAAMKLPSPRHLFPFFLLFLASCTLLEVLGMRWAMALWLTFDPSASDFYWHMIAHYNIPNIYRITEGLLRQASALLLAFTLVIYSQRAGAK